MVLDEPTHGLDPVWTQRFRDIVVDLRRADRTILIASHNLDELQRLADRVAIIDHGRLQSAREHRLPGMRAPEHIALRLTLVTGDDVIRRLIPAGRRWRARRIRCYRPEHSGVEQRACRSDQQWRTGRERGAREIGAGAAVPGSRGRNTVTRARLGRYSLWQFRDFWSSAESPS